MRFTIKNNCDQVADVLARIEAYLEEQDVPMDAVMTSSLCLEEILSNSVKYAFSDDACHEVTVDVSISPVELSFEIVDAGAAFDPLHDAPEPDIDAPVEERRIGGLGIHLVKNLMDDVVYRRVDGRNHLCLSKRLGADSSAAE
jgi:serine/threonine-protein kinase RsbW